MIRVALVLLGAAATFVVGMILLARDDAEESRPSAIFPAKKGAFRADLLPEGLIGKPAPEFELRDARGGRFSTARTAGRPYAVTFLYTDCNDICPVIGRVLQQAVTRLGRQRNDVSVIAVSVDPSSDTAPAVRRWLRRLDQPKNFHYLIGSRRELGRVWKRYYVAPQPRGLPEGRHTANIWLVDRRGRWRAKFSGGAPFEADDVAHDLRLLLSERN